MSLTWYAADDDEGEAGDHGDYDVIMIMRVDNNNEESYLVC